MPDFPRFLFIEGGNPGGGKSEKLAKNFDDYLRIANPKLRRQLMSKKITKKFYVGSRSMIDGSRNDWCHSTLNQAIEHARDLVEETDEDQIVVQIIRVVRRSKSPISVEKV